MAIPQTAHVTRVTVLIPAAGTGSRMQRSSAGGETKVLMRLAGEPLLRHAVRVFQKHPVIQSIRIIVRPEDLALLEDTFADTDSWTKLGPPIVGGAERQDSVRNGLEALAGKGTPDWVLVHDGARPLCSPLLVQRVLDALSTHGAVVPVLPVYETVRSAAGNRESGGVIDRTALRLTQTPQGFHWDTLNEAHSRGFREGIRATDDAQLVESTGEPVTLVPGERRNLKITLAEDLELAEWIAAHPDWGVEPARI